MALTVDERYPCRRDGKDTTHQIFAFVRDTEQTSAPGVPIRAMSVNEISAERVSPMRQLHEIARHRLPELADSGIRRIPGVPVLDGQDPGLGDRRRRVEIRLPHAEVQHVLADGPLLDARHEEAARLASAPSVEGAYVALFRDGLRRRIHAGAGAERRAPVDPGARR